VEACRVAGINIRKMSGDCVSLAFDETTTLADVDALFAALNGGAPPGFTAESLAPGIPDMCHPDLVRRSAYLTHPVTLHPKP
jgi:glycine dehydrogenase